MTLHTDSANGYKYTYDLRGTVIVFICPRQWFSDLIKPLHARPRSQYDVNFDNRVDYSMVVVSRTSTIVSYSHAHCQLKYIKDLQALFEMLISFEPWKH